MLPKKGSRRVTFEGTVYRWRESHGHRYFELRVEQFDPPGQLLCALFAYRHLDATEPRNVYRPIMTRSLLGRVIKQGLKMGWKPEAEARVLTIDAAASARLVTEYDYRYSKWIFESNGLYS